MGSWSVYCGISQIAIRSGQSCVLLPLKEVRNADSYSPYLPATLPIFGRYDDYGGLEDIVEDKNTKLIEEYFGVDIDRFCQFFTRGSIDPRDVEDLKKSSKYDEMKDWTFMFIDRKVYDFMSTFNSEDNAGDLEFGNPSILKLLGFKEDGESTDKRYNHKWTYGDKEFHSDGTWLQTAKGESIYYFDSKDKYEAENSLVKYIELPTNKKKYGKKSMYQLWKHLSEKDQYEKLLWILGVDRYYFSTRRIEQMVSHLPDYSPLIKAYGVVDQYISRLSEFGDGLAALITIRNNLSPMSGYFAPHILYLTPQCGELAHHQVLLEKFSCINKAYLKQDE